MRQVQFKRFIWVVVLFCGLLTGCFESKQDYTINPDGSGKVTLDVLFDPTAVSMGQQSSDPEKQMQTAVKKIIQGAKGIEVWKDVVYKRMPDGRVSFKGTAYFQDLNKVKIENYGTDFKLSREDKILVLQMVEEKKDKEAQAKPAPSTPPTDEEITATIEKSKAEWERSKPMMTAMLSGLKKEATVRLPGKLSELNNFVRVNDTTVKMAIDGAKMMEALDAAMTDEAWMRAQASSGGLSEDGPPLDDTLNEKYFGKPGPLMAKVQVGSKAQFDYKKEVAAAQKVYPKMLESLGVVAKLPAGAVLKNGVSFTTGEIKDSRTTGQFFGGLTVELIMSGDVLQNARGIRGLNIVKAVDDKGNDLLQPADEGSSSSMSFGFGNGGNEGQLRQELKLKNPARAASAIQELSGEINLYMPEKDPKSKIVIKNFMKQAGKPVVSDVLKKGKMEVAVLTREQYETMKAAKDQADQGTPVGAKDPISALFKAFSDVFSGYQSVSDNDLVFMSKDPGGRLVDYEVQDATGAKIPTQGTSGGMDMQVISFEQLPDATAQLVIYTETTSSLVKAPFTLSDLMLP